MKRILVYGLLVVLALAVGVGARLLFLQDAPLPQPEVKIGGPFALTDHTGKAVTDADYRGKLMLVYFGYTYCPDVCPTGLSNIAHALDMLGADADKVVPLFISVDPERDTTEILAAYVAQFHPKIIGMTGTPEQVADAARAYRAYFSKTKVEGSADYLVDHSAIAYLMGPDGRFRMHFSHGASPEDMAAGIRKNL